MAGSGAPSTEEEVDRVVQAKAVSADAAAASSTPDLLSELQKLDLTDPASFKKMFPEGTVEERDGKHYRVGIATRRVNTRYSLEDMVQYLQEAGKRMSRVSGW